MGSTLVDRCRPASSASSAARPGPKKDAQVDDGQCRVNCCRSDVFSTVMRAEAPEQKIAKDQRIYNSTSAAVAQHEFERIDPGRALRSGISLRGAIAPADMAVSLNPIQRRPARGSSPPMNSKSSASAPTHVR